MDNKSAKDKSSGDAKVIVNEKEWLGRNKG
jgi:hypothetical protein